MKSLNFEEMSINKVEQFSVLVLLIVASAVTSGTPESTQLDTIRIPGLLPPPQSRNRKFWSTLVDIEGCKGGIPFNPQYPNVVKGYCASITGGKKSPPSPFDVHKSPPPPPQVYLGAPKPASVEPKPPLSHQLLQGAQLNPNFYLPPN
ncbi:hypothetical protein MKX01_008888 [Papaver californicum]|nr:hypothetical protein MKX01_008888 [Papaver californicum]